MSLWKKLSVAIVFGVFQIGLGPVAHAEEAVHGVMMVVKGDVKVTHADAKVENGKVGLKVFPGDAIAAGADSRAKVVMSDKNVLNISPDTKIVIEKYSNNGADKNVELKVEYGKIRASVEQKYDGEKSKFNVKTPSAVAGVRGTDFLTGYNRANKQSQVITFTGTVAVGQPGPGGKIMNAVFVQPGQMTTASPGAPPEQPKAVPKEELNKMNKESASEPAPKSDKSADTGEKGKEEKKDKEEKKEAKSEESKDSKSEAKSDESKKEGKSEESKSETAKSDEPKKDSAKNDEPKKDTAKNDEPKKDGGSKDGERKPASAAGPSMVDSKDLGPEMSKDVKIGNSTNNNTPIVNVPKNNFVAPVATPPPIPKGNSNVNIIINRN